MSTTTTPGAVVRQLTGLDAQFLALENARNALAISGLAILDPSSRPGGTLTLEGVQELVRSRLDLLPPFRWKLATVPFGIDHPYWVVDPDFDVEFHVRELALPAPGDDAQLATQVERISARPLDRARPLWEVYVIQGLAGGRVALLTKIHHALVDGVSGSEILGVLFDAAPEGRPLPAPAPQADPVDGPSALGMFARGAVGVPLRTLGAARRLPTTLAGLDDIPTVRAVPGLGLLSKASYRAHRAATRNRDGRVLEPPRVQAPRTAFNAPITAHRRFSFGSLSLSDVKAVKNAHGLTVNDVVIALSAGALRTWMLANDDLPDEPLVAMVPMSVRTKEEMGSYGNRISALIVPIPTDEPDPVARLHRAREAMASAKERHHATPADVLSDFSNMVPPALFARAARVTAAVGTSPRFRPHVNVVISNVPGPSVPLYVAGADVLAHHPVSVLFDGVGVNITVLSYQDQLDFGIVGDRELAPHLDLLIESLRADLAALVEAA